MKYRNLAILGASAGIVLALSGCSSDAAKTAESAAESAASAVQSAASGVASAAESAAAAAESAAGEALASASAAASDAIDSIASDQPSPAVYTMADVESHSGDADCWVAISGKVYNLTKWIGEHPGGADKITALCGTDGTDAFAGQHGSQPKPNAELTEFMIGTLSS